MSAGGKHVLLLGATGLVGGECLKLLATDLSFGSVVALTRRALIPPSPRVQAHVVNFDDPQSFAPYLDVDVVICALGTTIKKAGSQAAFRAVDYGYPLEFARRARARGARHFLLVSSLGADARSRTFYLRVKGELEAALQTLGYPALTIVRPSLLLGPRAEFRAGEALSQRLLGPLGFLLPKSFRPVSAARVAAALVNAAKSDASGLRLLENRMLF